jgi:hypothetical protein
MEEAGRMGWREQAALIMIRGISIAVRDCLGQIPKKVAGLNLARRRPLEELCVVGFPRPLGSGEVPALNPSVNCLGADPDDACDCRSATALFDRFLEGCIHGRGKEEWTH